MHRDTIPIASPCGIDWNGMTLADAKKRFCGECKKHVHDLSQMTQAEARGLLTSPSADGLCVRYLYDERGEIWFAPDATPLLAPRPLARLKRLVVAAATVAAPLSLAACIGSAMPVPPSPPPSLNATMGAPPALPPEPVPSASGSNAPVPAPPATKAAEPR
jgi:hypothetical protein